MIKAYLGVDVGSVSTNIIALSPEGELLSSQYIRTDGQPLACVKNGLRKLHAEIDDLEVLGVGTTGSGRQLAGIILGPILLKMKLHPIPWPRFIIIRMSGRFLRLAGRIRRLS